MLQPSEDTKALLIHLFENIKSDWHKPNCGLEDTCDGCLRVSECPQNTLADVLADVLGSSEEAAEIIKVRPYHQLVFVYELLDHYIGDSWDHIPVEHAKEACIDMLKNGGTYICDCVACNWGASDEEFEAEMESVRQQKAAMIEWRRLRAAHGAYS
jgi:hypothetical protein